MLQGFPEKRCGHGFTFSEPPGLEAASQLHVGWPVQISYNQGPPQNPVPEPSPPFPGPGRWVRVTEQAVEGRKALHGARPSPTAPQKDQHPDVEGECAEGPEEAARMLEPDPDVLKARAACEGRAEDVTACRRSPYGGRDSNPGGRAAQGMGLKGPYADAHQVLGGRGTEKSGKDVDQLIAQRPAAGAKPAKISGSEDSLEKVVEVLVGIRLVEH
ncbi:hypothetical protein V8D89_005291 [Ganoderma adspersum]